MEIRKYEYIDNDIKLKRKLHNINLEDFILNYDINLLLYRFQTDSIDNLILDKWIVLNYLVLDKDFIITFNSNEYDNTHNYLIALNRERKINNVLNLNN
ncbi:MAG: hypothetical protein ACOYLP_02755 [Flavobacterium sp.]|uniref:hypothetical protein n=1 Tax=Flavobacterium sp. TaxID=239 RepID=UPI003BE7458A